MDNLLRKNTDTLFFNLIILILFSALLIRIYASFFSGLTWFSYDGYNYIKMANGIYEGTPYSYLPNGLPILIAISKIFFHSPTNLAVIIYLNIIFSMLTIFLSAEIIKKLTGSKWLSLFTIFCIAFYPNQVNFVRQILTETPATFLLIFSLFLVINKKYLFAGLSFFIASLFRSTFLPILPILFLCSILHPNVSYGDKQKSIGLLIGFLVGMIFYKMLIISNIVKPSSNLTETILVSISSYSENLNFFAPENFSFSEKQHPINTYINFIVNNPIEYLKQRLLSLNELWGWPGVSDPPRKLFSQILLFLHFPLLILALVGFCKRIKDFNAWALFIPIMIITFIHVVTFSEPRYTCPLEPCLIILCMLAIESYQEKFCGNKYGCDRSKAT